MFYFRMIIMTKLDKYIAKIPSFIHLNSIEHFLVGNFCKVCLTFINLGEIYMFNFSTNLSSPISGIFIAIFSFTVQANNVVFNPPVELANISLAKIDAQASSSRGSRGSRGMCDTVDKGFSLKVLVPGAGFTTVGQPNLYWSISSPLSADFVFTLIPVMAPGSFDYPEPLIDKTVSRATTAGIHSLSLADYGVSLEENREYEWSVSIICDPKNPSLNLSAIGKIKRIKPPADLEARIKSTKPEQLVAVYAQNGIWYDALDTLSQLIAKNGNNENLREIQVNLLKQAGMK
jgi:hypothetical protein